MRGGAVGLLHALLIIEDEDADCGQGGKDQRGEPEPYVSSPHSSLVADPDEEPDDHTYVVHKDPRCDGPLERSGDRGIAAGKK